jgi:hypothetical protein
MFTPLSFSNQPAAARVNHGRENTGATPADFQITSLPGLNETINFEHYAGHITFNKTHGMSPAAGPMLCECA